MIWNRFFLIILTVCFVSCGPEGIEVSGGVTHTDHDWFVEARFILGSEALALDYAQLYGACISDCLLNPRAIGWLRNKPMTGVIPDPTCNCITQ